MSPIRSVVSLADFRLKALGTIASCLRVAERVVLVAVASRFVFASPRDSIAFAMVLAVVAASRGVVASMARGRAIRTLHEASLRAVLRGDVLRGSVLAAEDAPTAAFEGIHNGSRLLADQLPEAVGDAIAATVFAVFLLRTKPPRLLVVGALAVALAAIGIVVARRITLRTGEAAWRGYRPVVDDFVIGVGARLELVAGGVETSFLARFAGHLDGWRRASLRAEALSALAGRAPLAGAALVVMLALLVDQSFRGGLTSAAIADAAILASMVPAFAGLARGTHEIAKSASKLAPLAELLASHAPIAPPSNGAAIPSLPAPIRWSNVSYAYPRGDGRLAPRALQRVSIDWAPGSVLVIEGANGSGKSTCLRLLLALARPSEGSIRVGDRDLADLDPTEWRRALAYLPQRPFVPERGTVADMIRLLVPEAADASMREALERVGVWNALRTSGGKAPLDVSLSTLSAGQRQRIALARVLVQDAPIVLLDEPDANLDQAGIDLVIRLARELVPRKMVAIVAHTAAIAAAADVRVTLVAPVYGDAT